MTDPGEDIFLPPPRKPGSVMSVVWWAICAAFMLLWIAWLAVGEPGRSTACFGVALGAMSLARQEDARC